MSGKCLGACIAIICTMQAATAQELKPAPRHAKLRNAVNRENFDVSMARLAAKAAFQPTEQPTQQDLLNLIVLMSLREQRPST